MENQHRKIAGYRELSQAEIDLMNEIKAFGPQLHALCSKIDAHVTAQFSAASGYGPNGVQPANDAELARLDAAEPIDWLMNGRQQLQQGLMALTRAVAQPTFF